MSQGARVALLVARLAPQLVTRIVLDGPAALAAAADADLDYAAFRELVQTEGLDVFRRQWAQHPLTRLETADPTQHQLLARMIERYPGHDLLSTPRLAAQTQSQEPPHPQAHAHEPPRPPQPPPPVTAYAPELVMQPALVLNGALDVPGRLRSGETLAGLLPCCERVIVPLARHMANLDNPTAYNSVLLRFFSQNL
jgi:pimeloyl-ACP methyl ester carboxylesterase